MCSCFVFVFEFEFVCCVFVCDVHVNMCGMQPYLSLSLLHRLMYTSC